MFKTSTLSANKQSPGLKDFWPFGKSEKEFKEKVRQEAWSSLEKSVKAFAQDLIETVLEAAVNEYLGLEKYERAQERKDYRNGYYQRSLQTKYGTIDGLNVPRLRSSQLEFPLFDRYGTRQPQLDRLIGQLYLAGVSTRKLGSVIKDLTGRSLSAQSVSKVNQELFRETLDYFQNQSIADDIEYLLLDGIRQPIRDLFGYENKVGLAAYGIKKNGQRGLLALRIVESESEAECIRFLTDLRQRGLLGKNLKLITVDGAPGMIKALKTLYPFIKIQRCWVHKMRNVLAKAKHVYRRALAADLKKIFYAKNKQEALNQFKVFKNNWQVLAPKAVRCLEKDLNCLLNFYEMPKTDWKKIRTTNYLERVFRELRRRTKVIGSFPSSQSAERIMLAFSAVYLNQPGPKKPSQIKKSINPSDEFTQNT